MQSKTPQHKLRRYRYTPAIEIHVLLLIFISNLRVKKIRIISVVEYRSFFCTLADSYVVQVTMMPIIKNKMPKPKKRMPRLRVYSGPTDDTLRQ